ncbi:sensor histidine kinase [Stieleria sp.]|uniref:sensor histidine kinase n=1 Tax=Stieleria sp. TaxID=2795976 RepID=UPI0035685FA1
MTSTLPTTVGTATLESRPVDDRGVPYGGTVAARRKPGQTPGSREIAAPGHLPIAADDAPLESISRLISETAHDLRAPLSTIREAIRLVRDGDLGKVSSAQSECLSAAINQCNCAVQLVDEMVQSRRFDSGFPNVMRQWTSIDELRSNVEATLQSWILPRGIHLLWDGPFEEGIQIYADATLLRRLIVNVAGNAIRVTREGGPVLIRATVNRDQGIMNWAIVDQGAGISPSDMELIGAGKAPAKSIGGLGLIISRQLAAAHFSTLRIESRVGTGTAVSFQTILGGPAAVAARWVKWRSELIMIEQRKIMNEDQRVHEVRPSRSSPPSQSPAPPRRVRIDVPSQLIELGAGEMQPAFPDHVYLTTVSVGAAIPAAGTDAFDALLQRTMRITELAYRTGRRSWVIAWDADGETGIAKRSELERLVQNELGTMRMTWGASSLVSATPHPEFRNSLASRLSDLMVRQTLAGAQQAVSDTDQVRLGTGPMQSTPMATIRLEQDVHWLRESRRSPNGVPME